MGHRAFSPLIILSRIPWRLHVAHMTATACHGVLILMTRYRLSYDAYTHMFFADHYLNNSNSLWDPRWYTGFSVVSYPPLTHQVMALIAALTQSLPMTLGRPAGGVDTAFAVLLLLVTALLPIAVYAFARVFIEPESAGNAAIGAALLPSIYLAAHVFGQLPTLCALLLALFALAALARYLRSGDRVMAALAVTLTASVAATHHATLLFMPFGIAAIAGHLLLNKQHPAQDQLRRHMIIIRLLVIAFPIAAICLFVIWPFWLWGLHQTMQTPIDHLSRHNFLTDIVAIQFFFLPVYGLFIVVIPYIFLNLRHKQTLAPAVACIVLGILGLGGTTTLPRLLFSNGWEWLTYDRFALWASIMMLVFAGRFATALTRRLSTRAKWQPVSRFMLSARTAIVVLITLLPLVITAFGVALFPTWFPTQPPQLDLRPIVAFLNAQDSVTHQPNANWRYVTFGFGDQLAALSIASPATTIDGSYHTARQLQELRDSGIGQIDAVFWSDKGVTAINPILANADHYSVRWGFVDRAEYIPVLQQHGWAFNRFLSNGVSVWENPRPGLPVTSESPSTTDPLQLIAWQVLPLTMLLTTGVLALGIANPVITHRLLLRLHSMIVCVLPVTLCFWFYRELAPISYPRIYFTYTDLLLFLSDGLIVVAVLLWILSRWIVPGQVQTALYSVRKVRNVLGSIAIGNHFDRFVWLMTRLLFSLCLLATLSAIWAIDRRLSIATSLHLWLLFMFYCSLKDNPVPIGFLCVGMSAALLIQAGISMTEAIQQSTTFLMHWPLAMQWPGILDPSIRGASVVQLPDGTRWLRAYGSLPHPNILGGIASIALMAPAAWLADAGAASTSYEIQGGMRQTPSERLSATGLYLRLKRLWSVVLIGAVGAGILVVFLTFSRSAWIGCTAAILVLTWQRHKLPRMRLLFAAALIVVILIGVINLASTGTTREAVGNAHLSPPASIPFSQMALTRVAGLALGVSTEQQSIEVRTWMTEHALAIIHDHPLLGVGAGNFVVALVNQNPGDFMLEPVHSILLLVTSELGFAGLMLILAISGTLIISIIRLPHHVATATRSARTGKANAILPFGAFATMNDGETVNPPLIIPTSIVSAIAASAMVACLISAAAFDHYLWTTAPGRDLLWLVIGIWASTSTLRQKPRKPPRL